MKKLTCLLIIGLAAIGLRAGELEWQTDLPKAVAKAKAEKKPLLLLFTGSDWCDECRILQDEVLKAEEFQNYAKTNFVLVEIDVLNSKLQQPPKLKKANEALADKYEIRGWPTLVVLSRKGETNGKIIGYLKGIGHKEVIAKLEPLRKGD